MARLAAGALLILLQDPYAARREAMVRDTIENRGVRSPDVLRVMRAVPRHLFMPESVRAQAYDDHPVSIGHDQTISQPYIVALMTELLEPARHHRVLEIGTGSGYQSAVLSALVKQVYSVEIIPELAASARATLLSLGYSNVMVRCADGYRGWPEMAPYDRIIVTAAPPELPSALLEQLAKGGKLVAPVGASPFDQNLVVVDKTTDGKLRQRTILPVIFVPLKKGQSAILHIQ
jgi:protein-L-isoaspartate(D-aspartate) O-methyltransferase